MIITITLNPSIDRTLLANHFFIQTVCRGTLVNNAPGGKGINVARAVNQLGGDSLALCALGGETGQSIKTKLEAERLAFKAIEVAGNSRTCSAIIDPVNNTETVINEAGPSLSESEQTQFIDLFLSTIQPNDFIVMSGSFPEGVKPDFYALLIRFANEKGARVILDASGQPLIEGVKACPFLLKVNRNELMTLTHSEAISFDAVAPLFKQGIGAIVVTDGPCPVYAFYRGQTLVVCPPEVKAVNSWGSGDCVAAGLAVGLEKEMSFEAALKLGIAAGVANTLSFGPGFLKKEAAMGFYEALCG
jgi:1-phosphofructokinase family hexose kinase